MEVPRRAPFLDAGVSTPGCWAYPDMLVVGTPLMTKGEWMTHFAAWCVTSSPLILGFDLSDSARRAAVLPIVTNESKAPTRKFRFRRLRYVRSSRLV